MPYTMFWQPGRTIGATRTPAAGGSVHGVIDLGIKTLFAPDDDTAGEFLNWLGKARKSILMAVYSFHLPKLVELLTEKHRQGVTVRLVLDHSQAAGPAEKAEREALAAAGVDFVIGTGSNDPGSRRTPGAVFFARY